MSKRRRFGNDPYTKKAREQGLGARSVFKLREAAKQHRLFEGVRTVLDLGASPGSWSKEAARIIGPRGLVVAIDLKPLEIGLPANMIELTGDADELGLADIAEATEDRAPPFDLVLSDMAPRTTGNKSTDHLQQIALAERALEVARQSLRPGGRFFCKVFDGSDTQAFLSQVQLSFTKVKRVRPKAVRSQSREFFVLATGFKPYEE